MLSAASKKVFHLAQELYKQRKSLVSQTCRRYGLGNFARSEEARIRVPKVVLHKKHQEAEAQETELGFIRGQEEARIGKVEVGLYREQEEATIGKVEVGLYREQEEARIGRVEVGLYREQEEAYSLPLEKSLMWERNWHLLFCWNHKVLSKIKIDVFSLSS